MTEYVHWSPEDSESYVSESQIRTYIAAFDAELKALIGVAKTALNTIGRVHYQFSDGKHGLVLGVDTDPATKKPFYTVQACKVFCGLLMVGYHATADYDNFDDLENACRITANTYLPFRSFNRTIDGKTNKGYEAVEHGMMRLWLKFQVGKKRRSTLQDILLVPCDMTDDEISRLGELWVMEKLGSVADKKKKKSFSPWMRVAFKENDHDDLITHAYDHLIDQVFSVNASPAVQSDTMIEEDSLSLDGNNRFESWLSHTRYEAGYVSKADRNLLSYRRFCAELSKGYGNSRYKQVARLFEAEDGRIFYDHDYIHTVSEAEV